MLHRINLCIPLLYEYADAVPLPLMYGRQPRCNLSNASCRRGFVVTSMGAAQILFVAKGGFSQFSPRQNYCGRLE